MNSLPCLFIGPSSLQRINSFTNLYSLNHWIHWFLFTNLCSLNHWIHWFLFTNLCSLNHWIHWFLFTKSVNSLLLHWSLFITTSEFTLNSLKSLAVHYNKWIHSKFSEIACWAGHLLLQWSRPRLHKVYMKKTHGFTHLSVCWIVKNQNLCPLSIILTTIYEHNKLPSWMKKAKSSCSFMDFQFVKKLPICGRLKCWG